MGKSLQVVRASAGNLVEWYDFAAYAAFAGYFSAAFFQTGNRASQLFDTMAVFAAGFAARPLGAWFFGRRADTRGRRGSMVLSVALMGAGSAIVAAAPPFAAIGVAAPALLVAARLLQGFSSGGEYGVSAVYLTELAPPTRRGLYSGLQYMTIVLGLILPILLLIAMQRFLNEEQIRAWGWRVPFALGALGAFWVVRSRKGMAETRPRKDEPRSGVWRELASEHRCSWVFVFGITIGVTMGYYVFASNTQTVLTHFAGVHPRAASYVSLASLAVFCAAQPLCGMLADRVGLRPLLVFYCVASVLVYVPALAALATSRDLVALFLLQSGALLVLASFTSIGALVKSSAFPARVRASGVGTAHTAASVLFGGTAPMIALGLQHAGRPEWFLYYLEACALLSVAIALIASKGLRLGANTA